MIELTNHILRVYFDEEEGIVEALEVIEKTGKDNVSSTAKVLPKKSAPKKKPATTKTAPKKKPDKTHMPSKPSSMKGRRPLPKIPNNDDE
jgi:hypothetical protein